MTTVDYIKKTDDELETIAQGIVSGSIFSTLSIDMGRDGNLLRMIFMPLSFMDEAGMERLKRIDIGIIYEYITQAGMRGINGYPMFMSMNYLDKSESEIVLEKIKEIKSFLESRKSKPEK